MSSLFEKPVGLFDSFLHHFPVKELLALSLCRCWFGFGGNDDRYRWGWKRFGWLLNQDLALITTAWQEHEARKY